MASPTGSQHLFILGTRGSDLALTQARMAQAAIDSAGCDGVRVEIKVIKTQGDKRLDLKLSEFSQGREGEAAILDKGIFTKELEDALAAGEIDFAVHSLKDVPTELAPEFGIAATLPRAPIEDVILTKHPLKNGLASLREGAVVATSSVRRARQLKWLRPDLVIDDIRGNVPTRILKLIKGDQWDAILLARAGVERLGYLDASPDDTVLTIEGNAISCHVLPPDEFLPAAGQGAVAIETRSGDEATNAVISRVNDEPTFQRVSAERAFLECLQAGCQTPVGVHTWFAGGNLHMKALVFELDAPETEPRQGEVSGPADEPMALARNLMNEIYGH